MNLLRNTFLVMGAVMLVAAPAMAEEQSRIDGFAVRALVGGNGQTAALFGTEGLSFRAGSFYMGGAGSGGAFLGSSSGGMGYGGFITGVADRLGGATYDLRVLLGGGGGKVNGEGGGGIVVEPSIGVGMSLANGWNPSLTASYLYMRNNPNMSGATVGLRINFPVK